MSLRLLIVADVRLYRDGLSATLASRPAFSVVGTAATRHGAREAARALKPDVAVVDMAIDDALELIADFRRDDGPAVVAFAVNEIAADVLRCAEAGAAGFVTADASLDELASAIEGTMTGEIRCSPRMAGELFRSLGGRRSEAPTQNSFLTFREQDVLHLVREGLSNKEISRKLNLAESTVKNHVHHVLSKLDVRTRAQAAVRSIGRRRFARSTSDKTGTG